MDLYIVLVHVCVCVSQSAREKLKVGGGLCCKGEISVFTAPVPMQNAHRALCQITNRNQTHGPRGGSLSRHGPGGNHWRSDAGEEVGRGS